MLPRFGITYLLTALGGTPDVLDALLVKRGPEVHTGRMAAGGRIMTSPLLEMEGTWEEIEAGAKGQDELAFEADAVLGRIEKHGDLFEPVLKLKQPLPDDD